LAIQFAVTASAKRTAMANAVWTQGLSGRRGMKNKDGL